jgi:DNA polymerase-3 subunit epsilon
MSTLDTFKNVIRSGNFLVLDTETTGLHDGEICQISIIRSVGDVLLDTLVKTTRPIPADASRIHGIYDSDLASAPDWVEIAPRVLELLTGQDVVIYNATYDRKMMHQSAEKCGMDKIDWKTHARFHCAMEAFAEVYGEWNSYHGSYRWQRLTTAADYYNLPVQNAHSALGDCLMTLAVCKAMVAEAGDAQDG